MHGHPSQLDVEVLLRALSLRRPVFHSEADFQHELAWEIRNTYPNSSVRLEKPFPGRISGAIDIFVEANGAVHGFELKYLTRSCDVSFGGEEFRLKNQGAQDIRKYDVCKDVLRMEEFAGSQEAAGSVVVLTNDAYYWLARSREGSCAYAFDIAEGRELFGTLEWASHTSAGTNRNREASLGISGQHRLKWSAYSDADVRNGTFRYLHVLIPPIAHQRAI